MGDKVVFGKWETINMIVLIMCNQVFLSMQRIIAEIAGSAGWVFITYVAILAFLIFWLIIRLYKNYEGMDIIDLAEYAGGRVGKIIIGTVLAGFLIISSALTLREYSENMKVISLHLSPISYVSFFFIVGMVIAAYLGLEAIVRFNSVVFPVIFISYIAILIGVSNYCNFTRLAPYLGFGPYNLFIESIPRISFYSGVMVLFFVAPYLKSYKLFREVGFSGFLISAAIIISSVFAYSLVYAYPISTENFLPVYQLSRLFSYGRFYERLESIFLIVWAMAALFYLSFTVFFTAFLIKKAFGLEYYRPLIIPSAIIIFNISMLFQSLMSSLEFVNRYFRNFSWIFAFGIPLCLLILASLKRKLMERRKKGAL
ncbi:MAG: GerAB/ArcD/ProY family transporter [Clostridiaceae bacterium]|nr:GerAB/ArcD/ProY family transporter [Clostridiaceae bacterium]